MFKTEKWLGKQQDNFVKFYVIFMSFKVFHDELISQISI